MGTFQVCQKCLGAIYKSGVFVSRKQGLGYRKLGSYFHKSCLWKIRNQLPRVQILTLKVE
jgi:hypothetical protein